MSENQPTGPRGPDIGPTGPRPRGPSSATANRPDHLYGPSPAVGEDSRVVTQGKTSSTGVVLPNSSQQQAARQRLRELKAMGKEELFALFESSSHYDLMDLSQGDGAQSFIDWITFDFAVAEDSSNSNDAIPGKQKRVRIGEGTFTDDDINPAELGARVKKQIGQTLSDDLLYAMYESNGLRLHYAMIRRANQNPFAGQTRGMGKLTYVDPNTGYLKVFTSVPRQNGLSASVVTGTTLGDYDDVKHFAQKDIHNGLSFGGGRESLIAEGSTGQAWGKADEQLDILDKILTAAEVKNFPATTRHANNIATDVLNYIPVLLDHNSDLAMKFINRIDKYAEVKNDSDFKLLVAEKKETFFAEIFDEAEHAGESQSKAKQIHKLMLVLEIALRASASSGDPPYLDETQVALFETVVGGLGNSYTGKLSANKDDLYRLKGFYDDPDVLETLLKDLSKAYGEHRVAVITDLRAAFNKADLESGTEAGRKAWEQAFAARATSYIPPQEIPNSPLLDSDGNFNSEKVFDDKTYDGNISKFDPSDSNVQLLKNSFAKPLLSKFGEILKGIREKHVEEKAEDDLRIIRADVAEAVSDIPKKIGRLEANIERIRDRLEDSEEFDRFGDRAEEMREDAIEEHTRSQQEELEKYKLLMQFVDAIKSDSGPFAGKDADEHIKTFKTKNVLNAEEDAEFIGEFVDDKSDPPMSSKRVIEAFAELKRLMS